MVGFPSPGLGDTVPDAIVFGNSSSSSSSSGNNSLWYAARTRSKPGYDSEPQATTDLHADGADRPDCWTLVSTPTFAASEIGSTTMRDPVTGAFKPQENAYLNTGPAPALLKAFSDAILAKYGDAKHPGCLAGNRLFPTPTFLQGQRWGSAFPAPAYTGGRDRNGKGPTSKLMMDVQYETGVPRLRATAAAAAAAAADVEHDGRDYIADDEQRIYYVGDFCSRHTPGVEAAVLSAMDAVQHLLDATYYTPP
jgi:hypothetical protein